MKIAIAHLLLKFGSRKTNYDRVKKSVQEAKEKGAQLVLLPSMFNIGTFQSVYTVSQAKEIARNIAEKIPGGQSSSLLIKLSSALDIYILAGPIIERAGPKLFSTAFLVSPSGVIAGRYRKIAVDVIDKAIGLTSGKHPNLVSLKSKLGLLIEHDLLYPEIARTSILSGASFLVGFSRIGEMNDKKLERIGEARSYENNVPVIIVGGALESAERVLTETPSMIIDAREGILEKITLDEVGKNVTHVVTVAEVKPTNTFPLHDVESLLDIITLFYKASRGLAKKK
ncbi:MAG: carbon-nitrogen hydrolase family protein [Fervidicoccaceae archaeon]|nr:carbon-nitrogen hydrolase family protein [Fervidicoccaceae archaeon]